MIKHTGLKGSVYGWQHFKCRCPECEQAYADLRAKYRVEKKEVERPEGALHTGPVGSNYGYQKHKCRCHECVVAFQTWQEQRRQRLGIQKKVYIDYEHGTLGRYDSPRFKCRCDECRGANNRRKRERYRPKSQGGVPRVSKSQEGTPKKRSPEPDSRLKKTAPVLKIKGGVTPTRTFELTPVTDCGEELANGGFCRRLFPCQIHPIGL